MIGEKTTLAYCNTSLTKHLYNLIYIFLSTFLILYKISAHVSL